MAGIGGYYYIGGQGGYLGADGLNQKDVEIAVWHGDRMALVANYITNKYKPLGMNLQRFIPNGPNDKDLVRKILILFASNLFKDCPSYEKVKLESRDIDFIDFSAKINIPKSFNNLLEETKKVKLEDVYMYFAYIEPVNINE